MKCFDLDEIIGLAYDEGSNQIYLFFKRYSHLLYFNTVEEAEKFYNVLSFDWYKNQSREMVK